jgi:hypothetical protein
MNSEKEKGKEREEKEAGEEARNKLLETTTNNSSEEANTIRKGSVRDEASKVRFKKFSPDSWSFSP